MANTQVENFDTLTALLQQKQRRPGLRQKIFGGISGALSGLAGQPVQPAVIESLQGGQEDPMQDLLLKELIKGEVGQKYPKPLKMKEQILSKIATGEELTAGEQQLYEETIRKPVKAPSRSEQYEQALKALLGGEGDVESLIADFPLKAQQIVDVTEAEKERKYLAMPTVPSPEFVPGTGSPISRIKSYFSPQQAEINEKTQSVINQIKTREDLLELLERSEEAQGKGIDIKAILEYFGLDENLESRV